MKMIIALGLLIASFSAGAIPLQPLDIKSKTCQAVLNEVTYETNAVCYKNLDDEFRLWFPAADFANLRDTGINTRYIINTDAACASTNEYTYEQLMGDAALAPELIETKAVQIVVTQIDTSACFLAN